MDAIRDTCFHVSVLVIGQPELLMHDKRNDKSNDKTNDKTDDKTNDKTNGKTNDKTNDKTNAISEALEFLHPPALHAEIELW